jgi:ATP-dependent RNA helicase RhlE
MEFSTLGLNTKIIQAVKEKGYTNPSVIQEKAIPIILKGRDVMAAAQTGTGKTAGFTLPILDILTHGKPAKSNQVRTLIITPTRELAAQIDNNIKEYSTYVNIKSAVVFGGVKINPQMQKLRSGADVLVATPGRLLDLYHQNAITFDSLEVLVLDEADRMLDMGFIHDIKKIVKLLPLKRQTLMFSATFFHEIKSLAKQFLKNPIEVSVTPPNSTVKKIKQWIHPVDKAQKTNVLIHLILEKGWYQVLVFSRTKHGANKIVKFLEKAKIKAAAIHGNKSQGARTRALQDFKNNNISVLVATDIAARGIDIKELQVVVNFDLPNVPEDYVHRIGRTGRAGVMGEALSLVSSDESKQLFDIERLIQKKLERILIDGFEPQHNLSASPKKLLPPKNKKPKKSKKSKLHNTKKYTTSSRGENKKSKKPHAIWSSKSGGNRSNK